MISTPPALPAEVQANDKNIRLLVIFHYILALFCVMGLGFVFLHYFIMSSVFSNPETFKANAQMPFDPVQFFRLFRILYFVMGVLCVASAVLNACAAWALSHRRNRTLCLVTAGVNCLHFPMGTVLGVFTLIVLQKDSVISQFSTTCMAAPRGNAVSM